MDFNRCEDNKVERSMICLYPKCHTVTSIDSVIGLTGLRNRVDNSTGAWAARQNVLILSFYPIVALLRSATLKSRQCYFFMRQHSTCTVQGPEQVAFIYT